MTHSRAVQNDPSELRTTEVEVRRLDDLFPSLMAKAAAAKFF